MIMEKEEKNQVTSKGHFVIVLVLYLLGLFMGVLDTGIVTPARAVQAVGGGGIMPIATAEFGTSFPPEKRGMALGMVGGVYGIATYSEHP